MKRIIALLLSFLCPLALGANQTLSTRLNVGVANIVVPGTSAGLVAAAGLPGNMTGSAIASGYAGETQQTTTSRTSAFGTATGTTYNISSGITLGIGIYLMMGAICATGSASSFRADVAISTTSATNPSTSLLGTQYFYNSVTANIGTADYCQGFPPIYMLVTSSTTYYLVATPTFSGGAASLYGNFRTIRLD